jgi:3-methylcrotonyl-CoA carboxylase alpha subunit
VPSWRRDRVMFNKVLVANRGEIAVRVMRTCRELGVRTVAVYSDADARARHVIEADEAVHIGGPAPADSYLRGARIIDAARATGAEAVHPGYGFLSENDEFADDCERAGIAFIGPPAAAIAAMGSKTGARRLMHEAGVPVVPGESPDDQSDDALAAAVERVGRPALVKPSAGGGGIGMRVVGPADNALAEIQAARRAAMHAFGDGTLYVERLIARPRHVEIQVFADAHGECVSLFERECSLQRRHQKVIEESPSPVMTADLRQQMGRAAVAAALAAGYRNAGTVEFLVDEADGGEPRFYFLEMNTRLQVEHPVTEQVLGLDLVRAQLAVAAGQPLPFRADRLAQRGHAIELRVYAEDPALGFLPQAGPLLLYREPRGPGIRVDSGVVEGGEVSVHYDPLIAKVIVTAETRTAALARADRALGEFAILGIITNIPVLRQLVRHPEVRAGRLDTALLDRLLPTLVEPAAALPVPVAAVAARHAGRNAGAKRVPAAAPTADAWSDLRGWRG